MRGTCLAYSQNRNVKEWDKRKRRIGGGGEEGSDSTGHCNLSELGGIVDPGLEKKWHHLSWIYHFATPQRAVW